MLSAVEDKFIPHPSGPASVKVPIRVSIAAWSDFAAKARALALEHRLCLVNYGFAWEDRLVMVANFRTEREAALFRLFWTSEPDEDADRF